VIGVRDPFGFRPLVVGRLATGDTRSDGLWSDDPSRTGWVLAS
jgi:glutamine phosphoribosylpyrophosphate amidotransferase